LIASATEIVCALGFREWLVGRSHECDYPPDVESLPVCSASRVDTAASSLEIDRQVKAAVAQAVSVYRVKTEELQRLRPTHLITQTQCEVCAVSLKDVERALCELVESQPQIVALEPMALADVWRDIQAVARAVGEPDRGDRLVSRLQSRLAEIESQCRRFGAPTVVCLEWIDPLMSAGNWMPELVKIAGGRPLLSAAGQHSPWMTWDELERADPDVVVILPCGFDIARTVAELPPLVRHPRWGELRAARSGRVYVTDGNQYFNRPGPRVVESAEILAEVFHGPDAGRRHHGAGWIPLSAALNS
jgi:iron complex transport system substrate-binding protein